MNTQVMWQTAIYQFASLLLLATAVLIWLRKRTGWAAIAVVAQTIYIATGYLPFMRPLYLQYPMTLFIYPVSSALFAIGLAGSAWGEYASSRKQAAAAEQQVVAGSTSSGER